MQYLSIILASILQFILGAFWYSPLLFGKIWMKIHHCEDLSKSELEKMQKEMGPFYALQFLVTLVTTSVFLFFVNLLPQFSPFVLAVSFWLGFVLPTQVSAIIWGGDEKKWVAQKIAIIAGSSLACLFIAASVFSFLKI